MKDFFRVMGKAFAIVFGSTSASALVLVLLVVALRPLVRALMSPQAKASQPSVAAEPPQNLSAGRVVHQWDEHGNPLPDEVPVTGGEVPVLAVDNCHKEGCFVFQRLPNVGKFTAVHSINPFGYLPRDQITKAQRVPVDDLPTGR